MVLTNPQPQLVLILSSSAPPPPAPPPAPPPPSPAPELTTGSATAVMAVTSIRGSTCWTDQAETGSRFLAGSFLLVQTHATPRESSLTPVSMSLFPPPL